MLHVVPKVSSYLTRNLILVLLLAVFVSSRQAGQTLTAAGLHLSETQTGTIIYVKPSPTGFGGGTAWWDSTTLSDALGSATSGDEIWVAAGTYLPGAVQTDSFHLVPGVAIYGGFDGHETERAQRDWWLNPTILSGDIGVSGSDNDNSYHVVIANGSNGTPITETAVLDGFTISGGRAVAGGSIGGGIYCHGAGFGAECSPTLSNLIITDNMATLGGGMYSNGSSHPNMTNVAFVSNMAVSGGGFYSYSYDDDSSPRLQNVSFYGNVATGSGGGMYVEIGTGNPALTNVTFSENAATTGGAMYNRYTSPNLPFDDNASVNSNPVPGEADDRKSENRPFNRVRLTNVILWGNSATSNGAEISNKDVDMTIGNSVIAGGIAGIHNSGTSSVTDGGGNLSDDPLFVDVANGNLQLQPSSPVIDKGNNVAPNLNGITEDLSGFPRLFDGANNLVKTVDMGAYENQCPATTTLFVDQAASGIASGSNWANAQTDFSLALAANVHCDVDEIWVAEGVYKPGNSRLHRFGLIPGVAVYGGFDGHESERDERDWAMNTTTLSGDIGVEGDSSDNSYGLVSAIGTFEMPITATTVLDGFTVTEANNGGEQEGIGGGFYCNGEGHGNECSPLLANIIFSNNVAYLGGAMFNDGGEGGVSSPTLVNASFSNNSAIHGGAIYNAGAGNNSTSSPSFTNVIFTNNNASWGGAVFNAGHAYGNSSPTFVDVTFAGNSGSSGGAVRNLAGNFGKSSPTFTNVTFANNTATGGGGGMSNSGNSNGDSSPILTNVIFSGNSASSGGALFFSGRSNGNSNPVLTNVVFLNNSADNNGGAIHSDGLANGINHPVLTNVSFFGNSATNGGAMYNDGRTNGDSSPLLTNVIMWGNSATEGDEIYNYEATPTISNSLIEGGLANIFNFGSSSVTDGGNNLEDNPLFVDASNGDLRLQVGSPAIDAGTNVGCPEADLNGVERPQRGACDMGAYEFFLILTLTAVSDTDASLSWNGVNNNCSYSLYEGTTPDFTPTNPVSAASPYSLTDKLGTMEVNYFYITRAVCDGGIADSNVVGEFDFQIVPGN